MHTSWNEQDFRLWLTTELNLSPKAAGDCISRCKRVEKELKICLKSETAHRDTFIRLMEKIGEYALTPGTDRKGQYAIAGNLRSAVRKFARYQYKEAINSYPTFFRTKDWDKL